MYARGGSDGVRVVQRWATGCSWQAHPNEAGQRTSHAVVGDRGVWLIDPLVGPGLAESLPQGQPVAGVLVLSSYHARDAAAAAERFDVQVFAPRGLPRVQRLIEAPVVRFAGGPPDQTVTAIPIRSFPTWSEVLLWHRPSRSLVVPDALGTAPQFLLDDERLGVTLPRRVLGRPSSALERLRPRRVLVGHGTGVSRAAPAALRTALNAPRRSVGPAICENGWAMLRSATAALRDGP